MHLLIRWYHAPAGPVKPGSYSPMMSALCKFSHHPQSIFLARAEVLAENGVRLMG